MTEIQVVDAPGAARPPDRIRLEAAIASLREQGFEATLVSAADEADGLPKTFTDGSEALSGRYPTNDELKAWTDAAWIAPPEEFGACACSGAWSEGYDD